jgi:synaptic vesicle membrane protein VAT-1
MRDSGLLCYAPPMRHMVIPRYGVPDVFELREAPDPLPAAGEVRIRVRAAGINFADILARLGLYPDAPKLPMVVGYEVAGIIDAAGPGVTGIAEGDRVIAMTRFGGYADAVVVPAGQVFAMPAGLNDAEGAAVPVNYLTAALALYRLAALQAGETVLVHNAGGGVGIAATQLALLRRATVIGTASTMKHAALRSFGVEHALDYRSVDVVAEVRKLTRGRGVDVVLDPLGGRSFGDSYRLLAPLGRMVIFGLSAAATGEKRNLWRAFRAWMQTPAFKPLSLIHRNRGVFGLNVGHLWDERRQLAPIMTTLASELSAGRLRPVVARTFPLERAAEAHRFIQARQNIGKVVLTV